MKNDYSIKETVNNRTSKSSSQEVSNYPASYVVWLLIGVILFVPTLIVAHSRQFTGIQLSIFRELNNLSNGYKTPALLLTEGLGAGYPIAILIVVSAAFKRFKLAWRYFIASAFAGVLMEISKKVAKEPRPRVLLHGQLHIRAVENGLTSFPSGHAAISTALALTTWLILPKKWRWLSILWIVVVAVSRIYLGDHTPYDILGGFAVGLIAVCLLRLLPAKLARVLHLQSDKTSLLSKGF
jgi:membrane-associated phospholipid phosphatase